MSAAKTKEKNKKTGKVAKPAKSPIPLGTVCKYCEHVYIFPCDGKRYDCANAVFKRSGGTVDPHKMDQKARDMLKKGKMPKPNIEPAKPKKKKRRVRLKD